MSTWCIVGLLRMSIVLCRCLRPWSRSIGFSPNDGCDPVGPPCYRPGHQNLITKYGPLDLLGTIGADLGYEELIPRSTEMLIAEGVRVRILNLETLIEVKEELNGEKDRAMLPLLRRTLEENKGKR